METVPDLSERRMTDERLQRLAYLLLLALMVYVAVSGGGA